MIVTDSHHKRITRFQYRANVLARLISVLKALLERSRFAKQMADDRKVLQGLSDHQLQDIGLMREETHPDSIRGFFDLQTERYIELGRLQGTQPADEPIIKLAPSED